MTIPGVGQLTALAFVAAIDDLSRIADRYKGQLKLKDWAFAIAKRLTMRKARVALARRLAIIMHAMLRDGTEFVAAAFSTLPPCAQAYPIKRQRARRERRHPKASTPKEPPALTHWRTISADSGRWPAARAGLVKFA